MSQVPYLPDVARLEWSVHRAHYAADGAALEWSRLAETPESRFGDLMLRLHPACALVESRWPTTRIWRVHQPDGRDELAVDLDAGPDFALVHRPAFRVEVDSLDRASFTFLAQAAHDTRLAGAYDAARIVDPDFPLEARLAGWVRSRIIVAIELPGSDPGR